MSETDVTSPFIWRETLKKERFSIGVEASTSIVTDVTSPLVWRKVLQDQINSSKNPVSKQHQKKAAHFGYRPRAFLRKKMKEADHGKGKLGRVKTKG